MSQVIIRRKAGQSIPEDFLSLCPTKVFGISLVDKNKLETPHGTDFTLEALRATENDFKDVAFTLFLSDADKATDLNDVSPYDLIGNDDDEPLLSVHIAGEFPGFAKEKSSRSPAYHLAAFIAEYCETVFDAVDKDLGKLMNKISEDKFKDKIKMNAVSHGALMFVAQNGACVTITQGDTAKEFPWGWVSDTLGYTEGKKEEPKKEEEKPKGLFARRSSTREKFQSNAVERTPDAQPPKADTAVKAEDPNNLPAKPEATKTKPVILTLENITIKKVKCPGGYSRKNRRIWAKSIIGYTPPNIDQQDAEYQVYVSPTGAVLTKKEIQKALGQSAVGLPKLDNPIPLGRNEDREAKHIDPDRPVPNPLPILSKNGRDRMHRILSDDRIKKVIAENASLITDPDMVQNKEAKLPLFAAQLGMKDMKEFDAFPFIEIERIGRNEIHDLATLAWAWKCRALSAEHKLGKAKPQTQQTTAPEPEQQDAPAETPPKRAGLFARRAAA